MLSLEHPEILSGEVCPAWNPWLFSSGIFPRLASLTPLLRGFVQSCTSSPSQSGGLPSLALPKPSLVGFCPAWNTLRPFSGRALPSLAFQPLSRGVSTAWHCLALPGWGLPCLTPLAPLQRGLWLTSRLSVPMLGSWIPDPARLDPNLPRPRWAAIPAPPAAPPGGREQQRPQVEGRQRPLVGGPARLYCACAAAGRSRGGAARWRRAVSAVPALPGSPRTPRYPPARATPLQPRFRWPGGSVWRGCGREVYVRPEYPMKSSTDTRCGVGPGVPLSGPGWAAALPIPLAPRHGTRRPLRAHLDSLPRTQECDRGAPPEPPVCPDPPAPW